MPVVDRAAAPFRRKGPPTNERAWKSRRWPGVLLLLLAALPPGGAAPRAVTLITYNVENLFDDVDDGSEYPEFRVERGAWGPELFRRKVERIAEVIRRAVPGGPDVVALQEVENLRALHALRDQGLKGMGYRVAVMAGGGAASAGAGTAAGAVGPQSDPTAKAPAGAPATRPALLSRLPVRRTGYHQLAGTAAAGGARRAPGARTSGGAGEPQRGILEVELEVEGRPLHLFVNHWKSRADGVEETEPARREAARVLAGRVRALLEADPWADIVVLGDLNEGVDEIREGALALTDRPERAGWQGTRLVLYDAWYERPRTEWGSYVYRGRWQTLDHILLSAGLFDRRGLAYEPGSFRAVREPFLLDPRTGFPSRWSSSGTRKGYSDHLPLCVRLIPIDEESE